MANIQTISFHVFFDENNRARENALVGNSRTAKITATGTKYQLQGFVCLFFAQYGSEGLQTEEMDGNDMLKYHRGHFEDDCNPSDLASLDEHYIISLIKGEIGEPDLQFLTSHLEDFVSGMEAVPSQIELTTNSRDYPIGVLLPEYIDPNWKQNYSYIDMHNPTKYELYTNVEDEDLDAFADAPKLATVNTKEILPIVFTIHECIFTIPEITIGQYLDACKWGNPGKARGPVGTMEVVYWTSELWKDYHFVILAQICHRLKVSKLDFVREDPFLPARPFKEFFDRFGELGTSCTFPFLSHLRKIRVQYIGVAPVFWEFIQNSNVRSLTWCLVQTKATHERILDYADEALETMYLNSFNNNFRIRELRFAVPWLDKPLNYDPINGSFNQSHQGTCVLEILKRNQEGFKNCVNAVVTLLGIRKNRRLPIHKDVMTFVVMTVWNTRSTVGWTK